MGRRRIAEEPLSYTALWARRIALFALVASILSIIIVRSGLLEIRPAIATFIGALTLVAVAILLAFAAFVVIWREGTDGLCLPTLPISAFRPIGCPRSPMW